MSILRVYFRSKREKPQWVQAQPAVSLCLLFRFDPNMVRVPYRVQARPAVSSLLTFFFS